MEDGQRALMLLAGVSIPRTAEIRGIDVARGAPRAVTSRDGFIAVRAARVVVGIVKDFVEDGTVLLDVPRAECEVLENDARSGAFEMTGDGEAVRVEPHDQQRRMAPSLVHHGVTRAVGFTAFGIVEARAVDDA